MTHPTLEQCHEAGMGPGLPDTPEERDRFEAWMRANGLYVGSYESQYVISSTRQFYAAWLESQKGLAREADQLRAQVDDLAALVRRLVWVLKKWNKNSELCDTATDYLKRAGLVSVLREDDQPAVSEVDKLHAQVAALEAEVARLREPVGLVWANHNDEKKSQEIDGHWYEVRISLWGGFYPVFCDALSTQTVNGVLNAGAESLAIAACEAHHLGRYREMQGK